MFSAVQRLQKQFEQNTNLLYQNERQIADQVYTISVRQVALLKWLNDEGGLTDEKFNELIEAELAARKAEEEKLAAERRAAAEEAAAEQAIAEQEPSSEAEAAPDVEEKIFGGDYQQEGENGVSDTGADPGAEGAGEEPAASVGAGGREDSGALEVDPAGDEDGSPDPLRDGSDQNLPDASAG